MDVGEREVHRFCVFFPGVLLDRPAHQLEGLPAPFPRLLPILLYPATSDIEKVGFNEINRATGHRYEDASRDVIKAAGVKITPVEHAKPKTAVKLLDALRRAWRGRKNGRRRAGDGMRKPAARGERPRKAVS